MTYIEGFNASPRVIALRGDKPGAGQTTTRERLAHAFLYPLDRYDLTIRPQDSIPVEDFYGGQLFRTFTQQCQVHLDRGGTWDEFEDKITAILAGLLDGSIDPRELVNTPPEYRERRVTKAAKEFEKMFKNHALVDTTIDTALAIIITQNQTGITVVEGKNIHALPNIPKFAAILQENDRPIVGVKLTAPWEVTARRITKRRIKKGELPPSLHGVKSFLAFAYTLILIYARDQFDQKRLKRANGVSPNEIKDPDIITIDTTRRTPEEVVLEILKVISLKDPTFAHPWLTSMIASENA